VTGRVVLEAGLGACFLSVLLLVAAVRGLSRAASGPEWARRIDRYRTPDPRRDATSVRRGAPRALLALGEWAVRSRGLEERISRDLDRAGLSLRPHEWLLLRIASAAMLGAVLAVASDAPAAGLLLGSAAGWVATRAYLGTRIRRRLMAFSDQLPDALQLVASSLRSGFTVSQAAERLARQDLRPLGGEMARAVAESRIGVSIEDALDRVAARMDCPDLSWVVMAIHIQREVGGNLADVIDTTVGTMRERTRLRRQVQALSAEGRLTAYILIALPLVIGGFMLVVRPAYMHPLLTQPIGVLMLVVGAFSLVVGWFWMSRIIKVEA
jgi:tight adherence protein B